MHKNKLHFASVLFAFLVIFVSSYLLSCGPQKKTSESPIFASGTIVSFNGVVKTASGNPVSNVPIELQNLNYFGYFDGTKTIQNNVLPLFLYLVALPFYVLTANDRLLPEFKLTYQRPDYFLQSAVTNELGEFSFAVPENKLQRNERGGIHIDVGPLKEKLRGKSSYLVSATNSVSSIVLCPMNGLQHSIGVNTVTVSWVNEGAVPAKKNLHLTSRKTGALVWLQNIDVNAATATFPKSVIPEGGVAAAVENIWELNEEKYGANTCLSELASIELSNQELQASRISLKSISSASGASFKFSTLTNRNFQDSVFLRAFPSKEIILNFDQNIVFSAFALQNLRLERDGEFEIYTSIDGVNYALEGKYATERFLFATLSSGSTNALTRFVKLKFEVNVLDLQEVLFVP